MQKMKILAFVDLHSSLSILKRIIRRAKKQDISIIVNAGDHTIFGEKHRFILRELNKIKKPVLVIHGNHETEKETRNLCKSLKHCIFIHNKLFKKNNYVFFGWGGGGFSLIDRNFEKAVKKFKKQFKNKQVILITHAPPYKTKVDEILKEHAGNKSIREFIIKNKPVFSITGHIHENAGKQDKLGKTTIINPGPKGKVIEI